MSEGIFVRLADGFFEIVYGWSDAHQAVKASWDVDSAAIAAAEEKALKDALDGVGSLEHDFTGHGPWNDQACPIAADVDPVRAAAANKRTKFVHLSMNE